MNRQERIKNVVDVENLRQKKVAFVGIGGSINLGEGLVRTGVEKIIAIDPDVVSQENIGRQGHEQVGVKKVIAAGNRLRQINPNIDYTPLCIRLEQLSTDNYREVFKGVDLIILATDNHDAQAYGTRVAMELRIPCILVGLYPGATAGEIVFWIPGQKDCPRCYLEHRYHMQSQNRQDPTSDDATYFDLMILDGLVGHIALAILTEGSPNYFGRLLKELGDRQFIQIKLRSHFNFGGVDPVAKHLGIDPANLNYLVWSTVIRTNGPRLQPCPFCEEILGRKFCDEDLVAVEIESEEFPEQQSGTPDSDGSISNEAHEAQIELGL